MDRSICMPWSTNGISTECFQRGPMYHWMASKMETFPIWQPSMGVHLMICILIWFWTMFFYSLYLDNVINFCWMRVTIYKVEKETNHYIYIRIWLPLREPSQYVGGSLHKFCRWCSARLQTVQGSHTLSWVLQYILESNNDIQSHIENMKSCNARRCRNISGTRRARIVGELRSNPLWFYSKNPISTCIHAQTRGNFN